MPNTRIESEESKESYGSNKEYQLGSALEKFIVGHEKELHDLQGPNLRIPEARFDALYSLAIGLMRIAGQQDLTPLPTGRQLPTDVFIKNINGTGWNKKVQLDELVRGKKDRFTGIVHWDQKLTSELTTQNETVALEVQFKDREGFDTVVPDTINLTVQRLAVVEAATSAPIRGVSANPMSTILKVSMRLEDYPAEKMRPRLTQLAVEEPKVRIGTFQDGSPWREPIRMLYIDTAGNMTRTR